MTLLIASIALEVAVAVVAVLVALKGRPYLYSLAFTFAVYVLYDLGRLLGWNVEKGRSFGSLSLGERQRPIRGLEPLPRQGVIAHLPAAVT
jgi:hypothetical protein